MKKTLLVAFIILASLYTNAQISIGFGKHNYNFPSVGIKDSTAYSDTLWIKNYDSISFVGDLYIKTQVDTGSGFELSDSLLLGNNITLNAGDSIPNDYEEDYGSNFKIGGNTVVIWPFSTNTPIAVHDSIKYTITLYGPSSVGQINSTPLLSVYPNPASTILYFDQPQLSQIKEVRICDIKGELLNTYYQPNSIDMKPYAPGTYMIYIYLYERSVVSYKIIKQRE